MATIELVDVCKTLKEEAAGRGSTFSIQNLSLTIPDGQTMVVLGPSGCGKTTLLKIIAGLIPPDSGDVRYDGVNVRDVPPGERRLGMIFQNYALYPHFSAKTNVLSYFLFRKKTPELTAFAAAKYQRTSELMGVDLEYLLDRKPTTLSGGEKQRVALGRCITRDATLFLVDEPFANLDQALREKYRVNLKILLRQFDITTVYVTHDHHEALILADLVAVMDRGTIEQVGTYQSIYTHPRNMFVAGFLNLHMGTPPINLLDARYLPEAQRLGDVWVGVRPEDVEISTERGAETVRGTIVEQVGFPLKNTTLSVIRVGEHEIHAQTSSGGNHLRRGDEVWLTFRRYHLFDKESGLRLPPGAARRV
jgi:multiple sugar transport system ATP-binding protein